MKDILRVHKEVIHTLELKRIMCINKNFTKMEKSERKVLLKKEKKNDISIHLSINNNQLPKLIGSTVTNDIFTIILFYLETDLLPLMFSFSKINIVVIFQDDKNLLHIPWMLVVLTRRNKDGLPFQMFLFS